MNSEASDGKTDAQNGERMDPFPVFLAQKAKKAKNSYWMICRKFAVLIVDYDQKNLTKKRIKNERRFAKLWIKPEEYKVLFIKKALAKCARLSL